MVIDAHVHIFPDEVVANREIFFDGEPDFAALYANPKAKLVNMENLLQMLARNQIDKAVVVGFPWKQPRNYRLHNDYLAAMQAKHANLISVLGSFDVDARDIDAEAQRCFEIGLRGLGELALYQGRITNAVLAKLAPVMQIAASHNAPVMLHANEPVGHLYAGKSTAEISDYYGFCEKFPQTKIVLAHWGGGLFFFKLLRKQVKETLANVWFDTAASPYLYDTAIYKTAAEIAGADKILFASDYPLIEPARYLDEINRLELPQKTLQAMLGDNAQTVFIF